MNQFIIKMTKVIKKISPFVRRSKTKMSKFHVPTFDSMCCKEKQTVSQNLSVSHIFLVHDTEG